MIGGIVVLAMYGLLPDWAMRIFIGAIVIGTLYYWYFLITHKVDKSPTQR